MRNTGWQNDGRGTGPEDTDGNLATKHPLVYGAGNRAYDAGGFGDPYDCIGAEHRNELLMELENA